MSHPRRSTRQRKAKPKAHATRSRSGAGVSHYTGQITHHVAPDIDAERDHLSNDLAAANKVETTYSVSGVGPTLFARNGGGDPYFTDADTIVSKLVSGCATQQSAQAVLSPPPQIAAKNTLFSWLAAIWRALP
jgi:hypothetical protein